MALSSRLTSAVRPLLRVARVLTPTGVGVLLSVGAHGALLAFGPQTNFSFAALSQAAQEAEAEETVVPILELSAAEQGRLPDFAQPRRPPSLTGLSSLALPPGIPFNPNSTFKRPTTSSQQMPSASGRTFTGGKLSPLNNTIPNSFPIDVLRNAGLRGTATPQNSASSGAPAAIYEPSTSPPPEGNIDNLPNDSGEAPLPTLPAGVNSTNTLTTAQALEGLQAAGTTPNPGSTGTIDNPFTTPAQGDEEGQAVAVIEPEPISMATAQGDGAQIIEDSSQYNEAVTSDEVVAQRTKDWYEATAEGKEAVAQSTAELEVDSGFKACRERPPTDGTIGVLVNPDGTQESATVLRSVGYPDINRLALRTLEYQDFGQPEVPTQYEITVKVLYEPEGCVESLPEAEPDKPN